MAFYLSNNKKLIQIVKTRLASYPDSFQDQPRICGEAPSQEIFKFGVNIDPVLKTT